MAGLSFWGWQAIKQAVKDKTSDTVALPPVFQLFELERGFGPCVSQT
jgi:hypothetical protein